MRVRKNEDTLIIKTCAVDSYGITVLAPVESREETEKITGWLEAIRNTLEGLPLPKCFLFEIIPECPQEIKDYIIKNLLPQILKQGCVRYEVEVPLSEIRLNSEELKDTYRLLAFYHGLACEIEVNPVGSKLYLTDTHTHKEIIKGLKFSVVVAPVDNLCLVIDDDDIPLLQTYLDFLKNLNITILILKERILASMTLESL